MVIKVGSPTNTLAPTACTIAIPLSLRRQKSGPISKDDCMATTVTAISQTTMIVAVTRPAVKLAYLRHVKYVDISINELNGKRMYALSLGHVNEKFLTSV